MKAILKTLLKGLVFLLLIAAIAAAALSIYARSGDGPLAAFPGGELVSGDWVDARGVDWAFATDLDTMEMQLLRPPRSRTVWLIQYQGSLYIPCGVPNFRLWKQWPHEAMADGRAVVRIQGKRYAVTLVRVDDSAVHAAVMERVGKKYGNSVPESMDAESAVWVFRLEPRVRGR